MRRLRAPASFGAILTVRHGKLARKDCCEYAKEPLLWRLIRWASYLCRRQPIR